jgi:hypothetical protein
MSESESDSDADGHMQYNSSRDSSGRMGSQGDRKAAKGDSSKQTETFSLDADSVATLIVTVCTSHCTLHYRRCFSYLCFDALFRSSTA